MYIGSPPLEIRLSVYMYVNSYIKVYMPMYKSSDVCLFTHRLTTECSHCECARDIQGQFYKWLNKTIHAKI